MFFAVLVIVASARARSTSLTGRGRPSIGAKLAEAIRAQYRSHPPRGATGCTTTICARKRGLAHIGGLWYIDHHVGSRHVAGRDGKYMEVRLLGSRRRCRSGGCRAG